MSVIRNTVWFLCGFVLLAPLAALADGGEENQFISILQSEHSLTEKDAACARLKWIGTARSVPALAALLTDENLSHSARYALESMHNADAENALRLALAKTSGSNQIGIINSLGVRHEQSAVPELAKLLDNSDDGVAIAAADALGHIGGLKAEETVQSAWNISSPGVVHDAQSDALLADATQLLNSDDKRRAAKIFQLVYDREKNEGIRLAAFRGLVMSSGKRGPLLLMEALKGPTGPSQGAALQLAAKLNASGLTQSLTDLLGTAPLPMKIALLQCLQQRGDPRAADFIVDLLDDPNENIRLAAINALGDVGAGSVALPLARHAVQAAGAEKTATREALVNLRRGPVTGAMLKASPKVGADVQAELIRALGARGDTAAAPALIELARSDEDAVRSSALQGLTEVAGSAQVPALIRMVVMATNEDARGEAADALNSVCHHIESRRGEVDVKALADAMKNSRPETRAALMPIGSGINAPEIREALRASMHDSDERVREAAIRALCASQDEELLPDMLNIAGTMKELKFRMVGLRGCVQLVTQAQPPLPTARKIETLQSAAKLVFDADGKRLVLSGLAATPNLQTLELAESMLNDADVKPEAAQAVTQIAKAISSQHPAEAAAALQKLKPPQ